MAVADQEKRAAFAREFVTCGNATKAARLAGVPAVSAATIGSRWKSDPSVISMIQEEAARALKELAPMALQAVRHLIQSPDTPASVRLAAARDVLDRIGHVPPKRAEIKVEAVNGDLHKMSREELERLAGAGNGEAAYTALN